MSWDYKYTLIIFSQNKCSGDFESTLKLTGGSECKEESNLHWES